MRRFRTIIESAFPPPTDSLWLYNNSIRYFTGGKWITLTGEMGNISYNDLTDLPDLSIYATVNQLSGKQDTLVSGTTIKTINGQSLLGEGNIQVDGPDGNTTYAFTDGTDGSFVVTPSQGEPQKVSIGTFKTINGDSIFSESGEAEDIEVVVDINTPTAGASSVESNQQPTVVVTSTGEGKNKVFNFAFQIPKGEKGEQGIQGIQGIQGEIGPQGPQGPAGQDGTGISLKPDAGSCTEVGDAYINQDNGHIMIWNGASFTDGGEIKGPKGDDGADGAAAGFGTPTATANTLEAGEQATVQVQASGNNTAKVFSFTFGIPRGAQGAQGIQGPQGEIGPEGPQGPQGETGATGQTGPAGTNGADGADGKTPQFKAGDITTLAAGQNATCTVIQEGQDGSGNPIYKINLGIPRGATGAAGQDGSDGAAGATPNITVNATVDGNTGTPSVNVTQGGTATNPIINLAFHNLKGSNGLDGEDATINLTQQMPGKVIIIPGSKGNTYRPVFNINDASNSYFVGNENQLRFSPGDSVIDGDGKVWAIVSVSSKGMSGTGGNAPAFKLSIAST